MIFEPTKRKRKPAPEAKTIATGRKVKTLEDRGREERKAMFAEKRANIPGGPGKLDGRSDRAKDWFAAAQARFKSLRDKKKKP